MYTLHNDRRGPEKAYDSSVIYLSGNLAGVLGEGGADVVKAFPAPGNDHDFHVITNGSLSGKSIQATMRCFDFELGKISESEERKDVSYSSGSKAPVGQGKWVPTREWARN
jgi:hypothetical protein